MDGPERDVSRSTVQSQPRGRTQTRGRSAGRAKVTSGEARVVLAKKLHADRSRDIDDICKTLRISRSTFYGTCGCNRESSSGGLLRQLGVRELTPIMMA